MPEVPPLSGAVRPVAGKPSVVADAGGYVRIQCSHCNGNIIWGPEGRPAASIDANWLRTPT